MGSEMCIRDRYIDFDPSKVGILSINSQITFSFIRIIVLKQIRMLHGCYCHYHIGSEDCAVRAFKALRLHLKYSAHKH